MYLSLSDVIHLKIFVISISLTQKKKQKNFNATGRYQETGLYADWTPIDQH